MTEIRFKRPDSSGGNYQPLPEGVYDLQIESVDETTSKKGNPQLKVGCRVVGGDNDGKSTTIWYSLLEQSLWKVQGLIDATGCDQGDDEESVLNTDDLIGRYFTVDNEPREYEGKMRDNWVNERASSIADTSQPAPAAVTTKPAASKPAANASKPAAQAPVRRTRTLGA